MLVVRLYQNEIFVFSLYFINITMAEGVCVEEDPVKPEPFETVLLPVKEEIENCIMADQSDDPMDLTDLPLPLWSNVLTEAQDAAASTSATPFAEPPTIAAPKSKAQKQREYRQSLAVSRNAAQAIAARKLDAERQRKSRLRKAAILALASGSLESTTASSSRSGARSEDVQTGTRRLTHQQRLTSAAEPAQITVRPDTSPDQIEAQQAQSTWNAKWASSIMRFKSTFLDNDFGHACSVCDRLWFKNDLKPITAAQLEVISEWFIKENRRLCREEYEMVCNTCKRSLNKKSMPPLAKVNGFSYPDQPPGLPPLDPISERLITPRLPFMQVRRLRHDFSCGIIGQVINIPVDVQDMVNYLPRQLNEDDVINVNIKQNLAHKSVYISGYMSKSTISAWLTVLQKSALYCLYEINVDFSRLHPTVPFLDDIQDNPSNRIENISAENTPESEILASRQHTMMWNEEDGLYIAPGHRAKYLNIIYDRHAEELSFPSIYFGEPRRFNMGVSVSPYMIATSEIRRRDRRGATPQKILYVALKILRLRMVDGIYSTFRNVSVTENVTRRMLEDPEFLKEYVIQNLAFMKTMPNSVQYWASCKRDLFAIIRQLGKPTVFLTISANEIRWMKLLTILLKLSKKYPGKTAKDLNTSERCTLVSDDPVTCCIYFYRLVGSLMKMLKSKQSYNPFGKYFVKDYFLRIEFQHQGSPHAHILLWLNDDPRETVSENMPRTIDLVETISSVARDDVPSNSIYANQIHKHTFTCTKRGETTCRFGIPYWPMTTTRVLVPIPQSNGRRQMLQQKAKEMGISLGEHRYACMDEFLNANCLTYVSYLDIVRSTLRRPTLVFRRNFDELMTNTFNPYLAGEVNSNIDIQFILDDYSCAEYVVEYVNKSARGMSNLHRELTTMMQEHPDQDYTGQLKALSIKLLNGVEMSAQEAAWYLLRQPMSETSRDVVYIPTVWPTERQRCRKRRQQMDREGIDGDSTDVWTKNIIQRYEERPESLEQVYLAEFASWYANANDFVDEEDDVHVDDDKDSDGVPEARTSRAPKEYRRRLLGRVIRYRRYDIDETVDYKREMVLLYVQFRNEVSEIVDQNKFLQLFDDNKGLIMERRSLFETNLNIENVMKKLEAMMIFRNKDNSNLQEEESRAAFVQRLLGEDGAEKVDVVNQIVPRQGFSIVKKCSNVMTKQQYCELVRTTNPEQREIILETMAEGVCVEEDPVKPEPFETVLLPVKQEIETMAEGVCVEEDPVKPESFETVLLPVKEEIVSEDEADGGETAESRVKVKEEIDVEDFQASEQLQEAASLSVCEESNDLPYVMEDMTEDGKDLDTVCLGEKTRLDQSLNQNMCPMSVERNNLPYMMEERSKDEKDSEPVHLGGKTQGLNELCRSELDSKTNNTKQIRSFSCLQCSAKFNESSLLKIHSSIHTGEKPFSCSFCSAKFSRNDDFKVHVRTHTGEMPFSCSHCSSKFTAKKHLTAHLRKHTDVKPFSCSFCSTAFVQKAKLKRHLRTHTGEKPFSCSFCSTAFVQKANLKRHLRTHTGEKPFSCSFCSARFTVKNSLNYHISTHTGEKPFSCSFCSAKYYTKKTLGIHILSHIGEKQFSCSHCSAKFYVKSSLVTHIRSHTGEKPFSCSYCSSKFTQKCHLIAHLRIHTGEKPFSCSQCSAKFIENSSLRRHIRTHKCQ
ncbi:uncharacterized protein LOC134538481 isoform X7 [Bacillus rossius redtenbacheri]|uniref:uncharacterized protein LOC134538481 isoform X7 n=1 Tax=Bacillus rossius redtenbacheri TaxID=93214 RepID=UPI002FDCFC57